MSFSELSIHPLLSAALSQKGYAEATPVQALVSKEEHRGQDLLVSARTGSGKTIAFGLVLADTLLSGDALPPAGAPLALVVAPTRELALQVQRELSWLYAGVGARVVSCVGGMDIRREQRALADGAHLVVGTPGRLCDHLERRKLRLDKLRCVVLDEADEMLDMGFRDELETILKDAPKERQTLLFSATLPPGIQQLAERFQRSPRRLAADPPKEAHVDIEYRAHLIALREREHAVVNILRSADAASAIVFCATRDGVSRLHSALVERGFDAVALSGELSQAERNRALTALRSGRARVLVATDVAARGLDLPAVGLVIQADLPNDPAVLAHRSGRTGRAGRKGISVLLSAASRRRVAERLMHINGIRVPWTELPTPEEVRAQDLKLFESEVESLAADLSEEDLEAGKAVAQRFGAVELAALLARRYREAQPAPEELPLSTGLADELKNRGPRRGRDGDGHTPRRPAREQGERNLFEGTPRSPRGPAQERFGGTGSRAGESGSRAEAGERGGQREFRSRRQGASDTVWFRLNVGRDRNADPRWLLPMLCRRGQIAREEIGAIRILPEESRFEVSSRVADRFEAAARRPDPKDRSLLIERDQEASPRSEHSSRPQRSGRAGRGSDFSRPQRAPYARQFASDFAQKRSGERPSARDEAPREERGGGEWREGREENAPTLAELLAQMEGGQTSRSKSSGDSSTGSSFPESHTAPQPPASKDRSVGGESAYQKSSHSKWSEKKSDYSKSDRESSHPKSKYQKASRGQAAYGSGPQFSRESGAEARNPWERKQDKQHAGAFERRLPPSQRRKLEGQDSSGEQQRFGGAKGGKGHSSRPAPGGGRAGFGERGRAGWAVDGVRGAAGQGQGGNRPPRRFGAGGAGPKGGKGRS